MTPCDAELAEPELHFPRTMRLESGGIAFMVGSVDRPFVSNAGSTWTLTIDLTFDPDADATIKFAAFDAACSGTGSAGTVFDYKFGNLTARTNILLYDADAQTITFNGTTQRVAPIGTPRYGWIEVWDGDDASARATYSNLIDLGHPTSLIGR